MDILVSFSPTFSFIHLLRFVAFFVSISGGEEDRIVGSFHPRPSPSYCNDWDPYWSTMGDL